jgi:hypothetical protein
MCLRKKERKKKGDMLGNVILKTVVHVYRFYRKGFGVVDIWAGPITVDALSKA